MPQCQRGWPWCVDACLKTVYSLTRVSAHSALTRNDTCVSYAATLASPQTRAGAARESQREGPCRGRVVHRASAAASVFRSFARQVDDWPPDVTRVQRVFGCVGCVGRWVGCTLISVWFSNSRRRRSTLRKSLIAPQFSETTLRLPKTWPKLLLILTSTPSVMRRAGSRANIRGAASTYGKMTITCNVRMHVTSVVQRVA